MAETNPWEKRYLREKNARMQAEQLLESKSIELYRANLTLHNAQDGLQAQVSERTRKLLQVVAKLKKEIIKRHKAEKELRIARDNAVQTSDIKTNFLASMSHEIRTPLNAIIGFSALLLESDLDETQAEQMRNVKSSGILLLRLINDILDFSKIEADKLDLEFGQADVKMVVKQSIALLMPEAERKGLKFVFSNPRTFSNNVIIDSGRLQQVLLNLLSNAVRYSDRGTITVSLNVEESKLDNAKLPEELVETAQSNAQNLGTIVLSVKDEGYGIREKDLRHVFSRFSQFSGSRLGTTGLGLAICKKICELWGGSIQVQSKFGTGSIFTVRIPCGICVPQQEVKPVKATKELETTTVDSGEQTGMWLMGSVDQNKILAKSKEYAHDRPLSILLADDYKVNRMVQQAQLEQLGYRADAVANGEEVLRALHSRSYDVILMDVQMPVMDGVECTQRIRQNKSNQQPFIVAVTASALAGDREKFEEAGMDAYVSKPVDIDELSTVLGEAFESKNGGSVQQHTQSTNGAGSSLDLSELYNSLGSNADKLLGNVIPIYLRELPARETTLRNAFSEGDAKTLAQVCHGLKGSCSIMGAKSLAQKFNEIEESGYEGQLPSMSQIDELFELSKQTAHDLRIELNRISAKQAN